MSRSANPGWYDDPTGRNKQRWWNGESWTPIAKDDDNVADDHSALQELSAATAPVPQRVAREPIPRSVLVWLFGIGVGLAFVGGGVRSCDELLVGSDTAQSWGRPGGVILLAGVVFGTAALAVAVWNMWVRRSANR